MAIDNRRMMCYCTQTRERLGVLGAFRILDCGLVLLTGMSAHEAKELA